jgi:hypothetical protein
MITTRIEKLKFIVEEMHLAFLMATHVPDHFVARTLARHILIRAENLIEHARGLRKPLNIGGYNTNHFNITKEAYADNFNEYFRTSRDKLGAHVQDFDFGKRLELWNDIEITKIEYFVEGAKEVYRSLASMSLPGYIQFTEPVELTDPALKQLLQTFNLAEENIESVEIGADSLAMTRPNTTAALNFTDVHSRASQLALIRRWIKLQNELLSQVVPYPNLIRILKARIVTDIVSFSDCLVTRALTSGAPQEMDGLNTLIATEGQSATAIDNFLAVSNFLQRLQNIRVIRDHIGAHLEINESMTISSLATSLDNYDLEEVLTFYGLIEKVFIKTCCSIIYLRMYAADGERMYGILTSKANVGVPFVSAINTDIEPSLPTKAPLYDKTTYQKQLSLWLNGSKDQAGYARHYFYDAFCSSETREIIEEKETFGSSYQLSRHEFRDVHSFILTTLASQLTDLTFTKILELLISCRNGYPYALAEVLVRYGKNNIPEIRIWGVCRALGEITSYPHASATQYLELHMNALRLEIKLESVIALFKIFVRSEGLLRINNQNKISREYDDYVSGLMMVLDSSEELLLCKLAFASTLSGGELRTYLKPFADNYHNLQNDIKHLCLPYLNDDVELAQTIILQQLIDTHDYVGVCVHLAVNLENDVRKQFRETLLRACSSGLIVTTGHDQASRHLAMCFLMQEEHDKALIVSEDIALRNPDWLGAQILVAQIMGGMKEQEDQAIRKVKEIRQYFKVDSTNEAYLSEIEQALSTR